jgi:hypothetical protein
VKSEKGQVALKPRRTSFATKTLIASVSLFAAFASRAGEEADSYRQGGPSIGWNSAGSGVTRMDLLAN